MCDGTFNFLSSIHIRCSCVCDCFLFAVAVFAGLLVAVVGTALFILFEYAIGPSHGESVNKASLPKTGENPWLEKTVKELADKSGLPMPKLAIVPNNTPNAFTFGRSTKTTPP